MTGLYVPVFAVWLTKIANVAFLPGAKSIVEEAGVMEGGRPEMLTVTFCLKSFMGTIETVKLASPVIGTVSECGVTCN